jgi:PAS domain-containing protein
MKKAYQISFAVTDILEEEDGLIYIDANQAASKLPDEIQSIIDCINDSVYITDSEGYTLMVNKASRKSVPIDIPILIGIKAIGSIGDGSFCLTNLHLTYRIAISIY